jgi:hypothetical protein
VRKRQLEIHALFGNNKDVLVQVIGANTSRFVALVYKSSIEKPDFRFIYYHRYKGRKDYWGWQVYAWKRDAAGEHVSAEYLPLRSGTTRVETIRPYLMASILGA